MYVSTYDKCNTSTCMCLHIVHTIHRAEHIELQEKLLNYFIRSNKRNIDESSFARTFDGPTNILTIN